MLGVCILATYFSWERIRGDIETETSNIAHLLIGDFDHTVRFVDGLLLSIISDYITNIDPKDSDRHLSLNKMLKRHWPQGDTPFGILTVVDKNGIVLAWN